MPTAEPFLIVRDYVTAVKRRGVRGVWVQVQGGLLYVSTLISEDAPGVESAVHEAELQTLLAWPNVHIEFKVIREGDCPDALDRQEVLGLRLL